MAVTREESLIRKEDGWVPVQRFAACTQRSSDVHTQEILDSDCTNTYKEDVEAISKKNEEKVKTMPKVKSEKTSCVSELFKSNGSENKYSDDPTRTTRLERFVDCKGWKIPSSVEVQCGITKDEAVIENECSPKQ